MAAKKPPKVKPFTPARVKKLAKDPGTRSKIPYRLLPEQYREGRRARILGDQPVAPHPVDGREEAEARRGQSQAVGVPPFGLADA